MRPRLVTAAGGEREMEEAFRQPPGTGEPPGGGEITVTTVTQLKNALDPKNAGRRILVNKGTYEVNVPLRVPDGASLTARPSLAKAK
jgi:hypothetical protein